MIYISFLCFFFNDTATTEIYTLSLHDALPICRRCGRWAPSPRPPVPRCRTSRWRWCGGRTSTATSTRSEEHTSELQSQSNLVCRLLLEKKKKKESLQQQKPLLIIVLQCRAMNH